MSARLARVFCFIRPHSLEAVKTAIANLGVSGLSVSDVRGTGNSPEDSAWSSEIPGVLPLPIRSRLEVVVTADLVEPVVAAILEHARSGQGNDGKIFVEPIVDALRVRTLERGENAV